MNPWTSLLDPLSLIPKEAQAGAIHILSNEPDPETLEPSSKPGPKPPATPAPIAAPRWPGPTISAPISRKAIPEPTPGPRAYRVPKPEPMTYADAIRIKERARMRQPVAAYLLEEANKVVEETRRAALEQAQLRTAQEK